MCLFCVRLAPIANLIMQLERLGRNQVLRIESHILSSNRILLHGIMIGLYISGRFGSDLRLLLKSVGLRVGLRLLDHESVVAGTVGGLRCLIKLMLIGILQRFHPPISGRAGRQGAALPVGFYQFLLITQAC